MMEPSIVTFQNTWTCIFKYNLTLMDIEVSFDVS